MKKLLSLIIITLMTLTVSAQSSRYRLILHGTDGTQKICNIADIDSISFRHLESDVAVDVNISEINTENPDDQHIVATFIPTPACKKYRFTVVPKNTADLYRASVDDMRQYFDGDEYLPTMTEAMTDAYIGNFQFKLLPGITYSVMVLSYDEFDIACNAQVYDFTIPAVPIVGNPSVECRIDDAQATSITVTFIPNADCAGYYVCFFEPGLAEKQFKEFGPLMGFACMGDMIKSFGQQLHETEFTITWDELAAGVDYEVYMLPIDANGNYAEIQTAVASTVKLGGEGLAQMTIELGEYYWDGQNESYYQDISFIPNDQTCAHRDIVAKKSAFDNGTWTEESLIDYMKHDKNPDYPEFIEDPDWDKFGVHTGSFPVTPGNTYYIYSIGKNVNGEYGPFTKLEFTAPFGDKTVKNMYTADKRMIVKERNAGLKNSDRMRRAITIKR